MRYEAFWFISGIVLYSIFSKLLNVGHSILFFQTIQAQALIYLGLAVESIAFINTIKYSSASTAELPEEQVELMKKVDEEVFDSWRSSVVVRMNAALPHNLRRTLSKKDWSAIIEFLEESYKKGEEKA